MKKVDKHRSFINQAFGEDGLLAHSLPGYVEREGQVAIAKKIHEHVIKKKGILFAEGPTGVGKSIAALVPAFELLRDKPEGFVLVVTSSILLQEQYLNKDIPFLENLFNFDAEPVLLKGKRNYLCAQKFETLKLSGPSSAQDNTHQHKKIQEWAQETETGDKNELDFNPRFDVWKNYAVVEDGECQGKRCPLYASCFYYNNRSKMEKSRIIVCNYHYYLLSQQNEGMLPGRPMMTIFDEAHESANIVRDFQEKQLVPNSFTNAATSLHNSAVQVDDVTGGSSEHFVKSLDFAGLQLTLTDESQILHAFMKPMLGQYEAYITLDLDNVKPFEESLRRIGKALQARYLTIKEEKDRLRDYIDDYGTSDWSDEEKKWFNQVEQMEKLLFEKTMLILNAIKSPTDAEYLTWIQSIRDKEMVSIHRKPFSAHPLSSVTLFNSPAVFISATLSVGESFAYYRKELGAPADKTEEIIVDSPFELDKNLLWYLPEDCPEGAGNANHIIFTLREMESIARRLGGKSLMLFTSRSSLLQAIQHMEHAFKDDDIYVLNQHDHPKDKIIQAMRQHSNVIVIGTKSFFTGVDIPGQNLSAVLIDKMPFPMIGDPVNNYLMSRHNGFRTFTLPETIITSKQAVGRLNRKVDDVGIVAIFDGRLRTKSYKRTFFKSFNFSIQAASTPSELEGFVKEKIGL